MSPTGDLLSWLSSGVWYPRCWYFAACAETSLCWVPRASEVARRVEEACALGPDFAHYVTATASMALEAEATLDAPSFLVRGSPQALPHGTMTHCTAEEDFMCYS